MSMHFHAKTAIAIFLLSCLLAALSGCATMVDAIAEKGDGPSKDYTVSANAVCHDMPTVLQKVGLTLVTIDPAKEMILAQRSITAFSYGEMDEGTPQGGPLSPLPSQYRAR
ncbi:MAG: hypothetical protein ACYDDO_13120 [Acidiferrobacterales bacterium]